MYYFVFIFSCLSREDTRGGGFERHSHRLEKSKSYLVGTLRSKLPLLIRGYIRIAITTSASMLIKFCKVLMLLRNVDI